MLLLLKTRERAWSPYVSGIIIGLLVVPALVIADTVPDTAAGVLTVGERLVAVVAPGVLDVDTIARHLGGGRCWWQVALVVGIALGALLSSTLSDTRRGSSSPIWATILGTSPQKRAGTAFAGGFVMMLGAAIADGDLIGHGLSGVAQLAIGSLIALIAMAAGGVVMGCLMRGP